MVVRAVSCGYALIRPTFKAVIAVDALERRKKIMQVPKLSQTKSFNEKYCIFKVYANRMVS